MMEVIFNVKPVTFLVHNVQGLQLAHSVQLMITEQKPELLVYAPKDIMKIMKKYVDHVTILVKHAMDLIITNVYPVKITQIEI